MKYYNLLYSGLGLWMLSWALQLGNECVHLVPFIVKLYGCRTVFALWEPLIIGGMACFFIVDGILSSYYEAHHATFSFLIKRFGG